MMRRIACPHRVHSYLPMGTTARLVSNQQCYKLGDAPSDGKVVATEPMIEMVKMMNAKEGRLLEGVPYCENVEAQRLLSKHCHPSPPKRGLRYALVCNTGPTGVGKSMLQCQNMLQAAHKGCLSVYIDFNGEQPSSAQEQQLEFTVRVALRIAWYCREDEDDLLKNADAFETYSRLKIAHHPVEVEQMTIPSAVEKLKHHAKHEGPVILAVDEFKGSGQGKEQLTSNLKLLCAMMDQSIKEATRLEQQEKRIYLAVSVYDAVSLADLVTASGRNLLHQPTPPVFPLWVARGSVDEAAISKLPLAMRIFFDEVARNALFVVGARQNGVPLIKEFISTLGALVFASAGHGRRVEALIGELAKLTPTEHKRKSGLAVKPEALREQCEVLAGHFGHSAALEKWQRDVEMSMNGMLNLRKIVTKLKVAANKTNDTPLFLVHLLEGLFVSDDIADTDDGSRGMHMRLASLSHYGLLGAEEDTIGYLPMVTINGLCDYLIRGRLARSMKHKALVRFVSGAATQCSVLYTQRGTPASLPKTFERAMMYAMCAAILSGRELSNMIRSPRSLPEHMKVSESLAHIEVKRVDSFPCVLDGDETKTSIDATLIDAIATIGSDWDSECGLAFLPSNKFNLCCDFVIVLPLEDGGRVVLLVQCKHWFPDTFSGDYAFDQFRWGQQFAKERKVFQSKSKEKETHEPIDNVAFRGLQAIRDAKDGPTEIRHVLLTVNEAPRDSWYGPLKNTLSSKPWNLPTLSTIDYRDAMLRDDEWLMDLLHMRGWCPSMAYSALMGLQVQSLWADLPGGTPAAEKNETDGPREG